MIIGYVVSESLPEPARNIGIVNVKNEKKHIQFKRNRNFFDKKQTYFSFALDFMWFRQTIDINSVRKSPLILYKSWLVHQKSILCTSDFVIQYLYTRSLFYVQMPLSHSIRTPEASFPYQNRLKAGQMLAALSKKRTAKQTVLF